MEWQGGRYESQRQWCTVSYPAVSSVRVSLGFRYWSVGCGGVVLGVLLVREHKLTGPEPLVAVPGQLKCVLGGVLLSRTLAGAVPSALSGLASGFGMDTGRFPVAVTTETTTWAVLDRHLWCGYSVIGPPADPHPRMLARGACVGGWVGCGPYSGRSRLPYRSPPMCVGVLLFVSAY